MSRCLYFHPPLPPHLYVHCFELCFVFAQVRRGVFIDVRKTFPPFASLLKQAAERIIKSRTSCWKSDTGSPSGCFRRVMFAFFCSVYVLESLVNTKGKKIIWIKTPSQYWPMWKQFDHIWLMVQGGKNKCLWNSKTGIFAGVDLLDNIVSLFVFHSHTWIISPICILSSFQWILFLNSS